VVVPTSAEDGACSAGGGGGGRRVVATGCPTRHHPQRGTKRVQPTP
jgi:hypothetical protein